MRISPDLIPHEEFHKGIWLHPGHDHGWYYFMKKENPYLISNPAFIDTVDEPLVELVSLLHENDIRTTPSCSGHHIPEKELSEIYSGIEEDAEKIKGAGLELTDVQNGNKYFFQLKNYLLPWSLNEFITKASGYQERGVIGIRTGRRRRFRQELLKLRIDQSRLIEKDGLVLILTNEKGKPDFNIWKKITKKIKELFIQIE